MLKRMLSRVTAAALVIVALPSMAATKGLSYYLPQDVSYNPEITKPKDVLGYQVGEWHCPPRTNCKVYGSSGRRVRSHYAGSDRSHT